MSLLDLAANTLDNFDAKKDTVATSQGLPDGDYNVVVEDISHATYDSGWECVKLVFTVLDGEHAGEKEFDNLSFAEKTKAGKAMPDFVISQNIRFITKLGALLGVNITPQHFAGPTETEVHEALVNALAPEKGKTVILHVKHSPNKKDPSNPYTNYELDEAQQPEVPVVDDSQLPGALGGQAPAPTDNDLPPVDDTTTTAPF
ncbi:DUF669 domain-containing protein [Levilactobacillus brevis]|uniref:DUF669 domain-containing protein n=1 Tax=Levilactobacillus brevis TaxID=1580 RepID=UPI0011212F98|nr:DUF669 domain-containing protein [Levilactobacillus brevis]TOY76888.1 hypothetical protein DIS16_00935 [Levilactobacillus brevis]